ITDRFSVWVMGGYKSNDDNYYVTQEFADGSWRGIRRIDSFYGNWGGDWAVWGGAKFVASEKATINVQAAYEDWGKTAVAANV
ncbi:porin, partial [Brucella intermedia]|uniref:porin n=1 Tax=Brucella intermedia TaxID=94625 RepID=UPI00132642DA